MTKHIGVILSGCGVYDGSEIHEAVATLAALDKYGYTAHCFAPDITQMHVVNHLTGEVSPNEQRNVLVEAARIARGNVKSLSELQINDFDAVILPGGFGAAKNLSDYAVNQVNMQVNTDLVQAIKQFHENKKPIVALCIAPMIIAKVLGQQAPTITLGASGDVADHAVALGANHSVSSHEDIIIDEENRIITSPCYMLDASVGQIMQSADNAVAALKRWL